MGRLEVTVVSETEKRDDELSLIFNRLDAVPLAPIFKENRSPVAVVDEPGDQSRDSILPDVNPVDVEVIPKTDPDVRELAAKVAPLVVVPAETT
ncbi:MAG: hypothetical protein UY44_C0020G0003 [Candidatus Kaiserbacteria bacterium GW2011_GWA2_49_19]|uniref:Uncharacterized protein n=1 Tax=Candidatus Kaiserbacteria bacterium GW2011_GWA2_49_19 TaxID=1618669 RepID=A0A0G1XZA5_9BACT|nr:MAG: hypothetical protein UY44_C0020G0003 [Candidatus Kaiserbacteria bacterium GW2011_GWA2_49_19]